MINGFMYKGPEERPGEKPDIMPLYADKPYDGYSNYRPGIEGRTRPYRVHAQVLVDGYRRHVQVQHPGSADAGMASAAAVGRFGRQLRL